MGKKISTENGQSTKLGSGHRHLKSGLVKWIYYTILIFLIFFCLFVDMFNKAKFNRKWFLTPIFSIFGFKKIHTENHSISFFRELKIQTGIKQ